MPKTPLISKDYQFILPVPIFRGCVETIYQFDAGCHRQLQPVDLVPGRSSAKVEIYLCFCNTEKCNVNPSHANLGKHSNFMVICLALTLILLFSNF